MARPSTRKDSSTGEFDFGGGGDGEDRIGAPKPAPKPARKPRREPAADPDLPEKPDAPPVLSVRDLTRTIRDRLEGLGRVSVEGELSGLSRPASGHLYFQLKDEDSVLSCVMWRSRVSRGFGLDPERLVAGRRFVVHGHLEVYAPRGSYSLIVDRVEERGIGALLAKLERLKVELRERGWFDRHRPLPRMPRTVGVVTSRDGAAFRDFLRTRSLRWPGYPVRLAHTPVQGPGAEREIARALRRLDESGVDVICLCRGGGSLEDLWSFNELAVAEAIRACSVPVVSGVGHESDWTLADSVADHRAHTPTDAAQTVLPDRAAVAERLERAEGHLTDAMHRALDARIERLERCARARVLGPPRWLYEQREAELGRQRRRLALALRASLDSGSARLTRLAARLERQSPAASLRTKQARLEELALRFTHAAERRVEATARRVEVAGRELESLSPFAVLRRGYSITRLPDGTVVRDAKEVARGQELETVLGEGRLVSEVREAVEDAGEGRGDA